MTANPALRSLAVTHKSLSRATTCALLLSLTALAESVQAQQAPLTQWLESPVPASAGDGESTGGPEDATLVPLRAELLALAFDAASRFPMDPHAKNRARAQARVLDTCLDLNLPERALSVANAIEGWRRAHGWALYAVACAERGHDAQARDYAERAIEAARSLEQTDEQAWRVHRIRAAAATGLALLGDHERAATIAAQTEQGPVGTLGPLVVQRMDDAGFDAVLSTLTAVLASNDLGAAEAAIATGTALHARFYDDAHRRLAVEQALVESSARLPRVVVIDALCRMAETCLAHAQPDECRRLLAQARRELDAVRWQPAEQMGLLSRLAVLHHRCGSVEQARAAVDQALELYEAERDRMLDIDRAGALRPLAEACVALGDRSAASSLYSRAIEEGRLNPNARPRADDLVDSACSMARFGFLPDQHLWDQMLAALQQLDHPW